MKLRQYELVQRISETASRTMIVWLEDGRAKVGDKVTLKDYDDPEAEWEVRHEFCSIEHHNLKRGWDNNI
jgi:hypothetical protein